MITSISDIQVYKRCRRRWNYSSSLRMNLTPIGLGKPSLELGTLVHAALADWQIAHFEGNPKSLHYYFAMRADERITEVEKKYLATNGMNISPEELDPLVKSVELGLAMMANYEKKWKKPLPNRFKYAVTEQEIVVAIPGTEHHLRVILDGLLYDQHDVVSILERKTYDRRPNVKNLENNDQFTGYMWAAREAELGRIGGIAYDGMWKRAVPPRGNTFDDLFLRMPIYIGHDQLDEWGRQLADTVNEMASNPPLYKNRRWEGCDDCSFENLCNAESRDEDTGHLIANFFTLREDKKPRNIVGIDVSK